MPFMKGTQLAQKREREREILSGIRPVYPATSRQNNKQIAINFPTPSAPEGSPNKGNSNKSKGTQYERYVGSLYEARGYVVEYNGINKGSHDGGIDLICRSKKYTVLVQCKCYEEGNISINDVYQFFGAFRHYAVKHPQEVVQGAFWTSLQMTENQKAFEAAVDLGINVHDGCKMPNT